MDDINFEELDKAVNSALREKTQSEEPKEEAIEEHAETENGYSPEDTDDTTVSNEHPTVAPIKRRGQFMDMVHPSSDMTRTLDKRDDETDDDTASRQPLRRPVSPLKPLSPEIVEGTSAAPVEAEVAPDEDVLSSDNINETVDQQEHLDQTDVVAVEGSFEDDEAETAAVSSEQQNGEEANPEEVLSEEDEAYDADMSATPTSPFLEGTEVEKRPLGAFAGEAGDHAPNEPEQTNPVDETVVNSSEPPLVEDVDEIAPAVAAEGSTEAPAEFHSEIVAIEADDPDAHHDEPESDRGTAQSIPQQYTATPASSEPDSEEHAVFDTSEYHQPLSPPEKPKKGSHTAFYVIIGILMLLIGSIAGYLAFILKLF